MQFAAPQGQRPSGACNCVCQNPIVSSLNEHEALVEAIFAAQCDDAANVAHDHVQVRVQGSGFDDFAALLRAQQRV